MKFRRLTAIVAMAALALIPLSSCEDGGSGGGASKIGKSLTKVTGKLKGLGKGKIKVSALVGKKIIPALIEKGQFMLGDLPPGPKSLIVEKDGQRMPVKFPKSQSKQGALAGMLPDVNTASEDFDFGDLAIAASKSDGKAYVIVKNNPFASLFDTDGNGTFDWSDDDIDGDGIPNLDDDAAWGDDWADWGWEDEFYGDFDADGDGVWDWESDEDWGTWDGYEEWESDDWGYEYDEADWEGYDDDEWWNEMDDDYGWDDSWDAGDDWGTDEWGDDGGDGWDDGGDGGDGGDDGGSGWDGGDCPSYEYDDYGNCVE